MTKKCTKCNIEKYIHNFGIRGNRKNSLCKKCNTLKTKEYYKKYPWKRTLNNIKQRCNNPKNPFYKNYGGREIKCLITVDELKRLWFRDKAWLLRQASIDRKDNDGNYTFENCQFIEQSINTTERNIRASSKNILQYDLQGNFIKEWKSAACIYRILGFVNSNISAVCLGKRKTANKYIWKFKK